MVEATEEVVVVVVGVVEMEVDVDGDRVVEEVGEEPDEIENEEESYGGLHYPLLAPAEA